MRRVAMAGVLAMKPSYLLLDEPFSGLDLPGRRELLNTLRTLRDEGKGILLVTHEWEEVVILADRVSLLSDGRILISGEKEGVLTSMEELGRAGLCMPPMVEVLSELRQRGIDLPPYASSPGETATLIARAFRGGGS